MSRLNRFQYESDRHDFADMHQKIKGIYQILICQSQTLDMDTPGGQEGAKILKELLGNLDDVGADWNNESDPPERASKKRFVQGSVTDQTMTVPVSCSAVSEDGLGSKDGFSAKQKRRKAMLKSSRISWTPFGKFYYQSTEYHIVSSLYGRDE